MTDVFYPRALVQLHARVLGQDVTTSIEPHRVSLTRRPHNQADEVEVEIHGTALPFEPRHIEDLWLGVFLGDPRSMSGRVDTDRFLRFVGYADDMEPGNPAAEAPRVKITARDRSAQLRDFKPLPVAAQPRYGDMLGQAIERILAAVPSAVGMELRSSEHASIPLAPLVSARARAGRIPLPNDCTAWQAIEHVCGLCAREVTIDLEDVVIQVPTAARSSPSEAAANFVFGGVRGNLLEAKRKKKFQRNRNGVRVVSFDPATRRRVEAVYPPDGQLPRRHRARGRRGGGGAQPPERDIFALGDGITSHDQLEEYARRIYLERSRQEVEVEIECPFPTDQHIGLRNGDRVSIEIEPGLADDIRGSGTGAVALLERRLGVDREVAQILVRSAREPTTNLFYAKTITTEFSATEKTVVKIDAINLILAIDDRQAA
jgi:hypothetical protein